MQNDHLYLLNIRSSRASASPTKVPKHSLGITAIGDRSFNADSEVKSGSPHSNSHLAHGEASRKYEVISSKFANALSLITFLLEEEVSSEQLSSHQEVSSPENTSR